MALDPLPVLYEDPDVITRPLQKASESYVKLTRRGKPEKPSDASVALQESDAVAADQAFRYMAKAAGSVENKIVQSLFSPTNDALPEDLKQFGAAGLMELNGAYEALTGDRIPIQPETLKALQEKRISPEIAHHAGQIAGGLALMAGMGSVLGAEKLAGAAGEAFYRSPAVARFLMPSIKWGVSTGGATAVEEGIRQVRENTLDMQRLGKLVLGSTAVGAAGGAVMEAFPPGLLRIAGASAYGYGSKRMEGASQTEAAVHGGIFALFAAASTKEITSAQKEGAFKTAVKNVGEATRSEAQTKGYSAAEAEQLSKDTAQTFKTWVDSKGGVDNLEVKDYDKGAKEIWGEIKNVVDQKPSENVLEVAAAIESKTTPEEPKAQEPWQMTKAEFIASRPPLDPQVEALNKDPQVIASFIRTFGKGDTGITETSLPNRPGKYFVYRNDQGRPLGVLHYNDTPGAEHLGIAVDPSAQRQGIATRLLDFADTSGVKVADILKTSKATEQGASLFHKYLTARAVESGENVPESVLKDYPDLKPQPFQAAPDEIAAIRGDVQQGEAGQRVFIRERSEDSALRGTLREVIGTHSTFPDYFRDKGYTKDQVLNIIDKHAQGKPLTAKQQKILQDLVESRREMIASAESRSKTRSDLEAQIAQQKEQADYEQFAVSLESVQQNPYALLRPSGPVGEMFQFPPDSRVQEFKTKEHKGEKVYTQEDVEKEIEREYISKDLGLWKKEFLYHVKRLSDDRPLKDTPLIHIDFDNLKALNAKLGHVHADRMFEIFAQKLAEFGFHGARVGGDEFVIILNPIHKGGENPLDTFQRFHEFQNEMLIAEVVSDDEEVLHRGLTMSAGFGVGVKNADDVAIGAKNTGKNKLVIDKQFLTEYNQSEGTAYEWTAQALSLETRAGQPLPGQAPGQGDQGPRPQEALQPPQENLTPKTEAVNLGGQIQDQFLTPGTPPRELPKTSAGPTSPQVSDSALLEGFRPDTQERFDLRSEILPGAKAFVEKDLGPVTEAILKGAADSYKKLVALVAPRTLANRESVDALMRMKGEREKAQFQLQHSMAAVKKFFESRSPAENVDFIDRYKTGQPQPTQELQDIADAYRTLDQSVYDELLTYKPTLTQIENHYRVLWKRIPASPQAIAFLKASGVDSETILSRLVDYKEKLKGETLTEEEFGQLAEQIGNIPAGSATSARYRTYHSRRPLQGSKGMLRRHTLDDMSEGLALGGEPITYNPQTMIELAYGDAMKFITAHKMWAVGKEIGQIKFIKTGAQRPEGFSVIDDAIARVFFPSEYGLVKAGERYAQNDFSRMVNNYLSRDLVRENALGRGLLFVKNVTTSVELSLSPFHAVFETNEIFSSSLGLAIRKMLEPGHRVQGMRELAAFLGSPYSVSREGKAAIEYVGNKAEFIRQNPDAYRWFLDKYPDADLLIDDLFMGGGKLQMHEDYRTETSRSMRESWNENNYIGAVLRAVPEINQAIMRPLFNTYIPRLKIGQFLREYSFELTHKPDTVSRAQLARQVWDSIDNRFGEMNFDNLFWNRTFKTSLQLLFRSVTWKLGNIREYDSAIRGQMLEIKESVQERRPPRMTRSFGWLTGMAITTALQAVLLTKLLTGKYPWDYADTAGELVKNLVYPRTSATNPKERVASIGYWRDAFSLIHSPTHYVASSTNGEIARILEAMENKDFYGVQVYDPDDPTVKKSWDIVKHIIPIPFSISSFLSMSESGESGRKAAMSFAGLTKAPAWVSQTEAEKTAERFMLMRVPALRTKEQFEKSRATRAIVESLRGGKSAAEGIRKAVAEGKIAPDQASRVYETARNTPLQNAVKRLPMDDAMKVLANTTPQEREALKGIMYEKFSNTIDRLPADRGRALLERLRKYYPATNGGE